MEAAHFSLLLFLLLPAFAADAVLAEFWNIDCGASVEHTDATMNLTWVTDRGYVGSGESHMIPPGNTVGVPTALTTLRAFPGKTRKNCYTVPVQEKTKIMVRVSFYYGNYDGLAKPPSFQLIFDSKDWDTVKTGMDWSSTYSIIYVTSRNHTDICLWRLNDGEVPFVSYIQIRTLDPLMYGGLLMSNFSLYNPRRYSFGLNHTLRYLGGLGLSGDIPDFSKLDALVFIDLQDNNFSGSVPESLASFPKLQSLNLAYNDFSSIPSVFNKNTIALNITGNPRLCSEGKICIYSPDSPPPPPSKSMNAPLPPPNGRNGAPARSIFPHPVIMLGLSLMFFM